jgi:naphthalene 1,2-dioxygenase system ferredoxin subunit
VKAGRWIEVARVEEVPEDGTLGRDVESRRVCLYRLPSGIYATDGICTHGNADLADGFIDGDEIECPLHQGRFHIPTGKATGVPCVTDIQAFTVRVEGEVLFLDAEELAAKPATP